MASSKKQKPEWRTLYDSCCSQYDRVEWCDGCGVVKITRVGRKPTYRVPKREAARRVKAKGGFVKQDGKTLDECCNKSAILITDETQISDVFRCKPGMRDSEQQREFGGAG